MFLFPRTGKTVSAETVDRQQTIANIAGLEKGQESDDLDWRSESAQEKYEIQKYFGEIFW